MEETQNEIQIATTMLIKAIGEDPQREGLRNTPERVARMYQELCCGYSMNLENIINDAVFSDKTGSMVLVSNISFYSLCEHHMLPFFGHVNVAYIPNGKIIGLSKIPRIVEMFSHRLQIQERLTYQIAEALEQVIHPKGIAILVNAKHLCSVMRGVRKEEAELTTRVFTGVFETELNLRDEFYRIILPNCQSLPDKTNQTGL